MAIRNLQYPAPVLQAYDEFGRPIVPPLPDAPQLPEISQVFAPPNASLTGAIGPGDVPYGAAPISAVAPFNAPAPAIAPAAPGPISFAPPTIQMAPESPLEQQAREYLTNIPKPEQFKQSRLHRILNAIAAGGVGATQGAEKGVAIGQELSQGPYKRAVEQWRTQAAAYEPLLQMEERRRQAGIKAAEMGIQQASLLSKDQLQRLTLEEKKRLDDSTIAYNAAKIAKKTGLEYEAWLQQTDPGLLQSIYKARRETPEEKGQGAEAEAQGKANVVNRPENIIGAARAAGALEASKKAGELGVVLSPDMMRRRAQLEGMIAAAKKGAEAQLTPAQGAVVDNFVARAAADPDSVHKVAKELPTPEMRTAFWDRYARDPKNKVPREISEGQITVRTAALGAIQHADLIEKLLADNPKLLGRIGPILGRVTAAGQIIGKPIFNDDPALAKVEEQFLGQLRNMVLFEASATSGTRPSWQLIKYLEGFSPSERFTLPMMQGALEASRVAARVKLDSIYGSSSEGRPVGSPISPGTVGNVAAPGEIRILSVKEK